MAFVEVAIKQEVLMNWQPFPHPPPFLKWVIRLFVLMPFMLRNYDWEKDTIEDFKSRLSQYKTIEDGKWEDWVEDTFMSSYESWAFVELIKKFNLCFKFSIFKCNM
jgi:hypothetical protein